MITKCLKGTASVSYTSVLVSDLNFFTAMCSCIGLLFCAVERLRVSVRDIYGFIICGLDVRKSLYIRSFIISICFDYSVDAILAFVVLCDVIFEDIKIYIPFLL
jgi:hypothetical protein